MTLEEAKDYIKSVRWQYAKTYITAPHEYTVLDWKPETKQQMIDFADFILANGYKEQFYSKTYTVLQIGEYKYWSMDFPTVNTNLINRTFIDEKRKAKIVKFVQTPGFKYAYKMSLKDVEEQYQCSVVVTNYEEFRKIVCEMIKKQHPYIKSDEEVEKFIEQGGGEGTIKAMYNENKEDFAEGRYVYSQAAAAAMNLN